MNALMNPQPIYERTKVLVVGLLDRQQAMIQREFQDLNVRFTDKESITQDGLYRWAERTLIITKFISHAMWDHIDRAKVGYFKGMAGLRNHLREIRAQAKQAAIAKAAPPPVTIDFSAIRTSVTGDSLEFVRPERMEAHVFAQNVQAAIDFYRKQNGIIAGYIIGGGKAIVTIESGSRPMLEKAERELLEGDRFYVADFMDELKSLWAEFYLESFRLRPFAIPGDHAALATTAAKEWADMTGEN